MKKVIKQITDKTCKTVWHEDNIDKKKQLLLDIVYDFVHKNKQKKFIYDIHKPSYSKSADLDFMVTNLKLKPEGLGVRQFSSGDAEYIQAVAYDSQLHCF